ncbi:MAG: amino acid ABC transporter permease [Chloroflexi bacterium B3_Chlor]|nr:MAG: amino acid ABC transporter permease [Chloroflexi bacterium B3_Chlor]
MKPPRTEVGVLGWLKKNLFGTWYDALLTVGSVAFISVVLYGVTNWALTGAKWGVVTTNIKVFMVGRYPYSEIWRIWASIGLFAVMAAITGVVWRLNIARARRAVTISWIVVSLLTVVLLAGFGENTPIPRVPLAIWSGLMLTLTLGIVGIVASFPIGVLLALGRRSNLPVIKVFSTMFIEIVRGVPLITVLFIAMLMLPLFLPASISGRLSNVLRVMVGMTLFSAAYVAENVRGGLQAIPKGQYEAGRAVGLNEAYVMALIVLPQALRAMIPAIVGQFISLYKDTSLVVIVGLLDLLGIAKAVTGQTEWIGTQKEVFAFAGVIYFITCSALSYASRRLEKQLGVGER